MTAGKIHFHPNGLNPRMLREEPMRRCQLAECRGACCLHGVWVDQTERDDILANAERIAPYMPEALRDPAVWFKEGGEPDEFSSSGTVFHSNVLPDAAHYGGTACVFFREDFKCALQVAGEALGMHPWRFKPFYCILHPMDLDEKGRITLDDTASLLEEEASCLRPCDHSTALAETFSPELKYLLGEGFIPH
jgi:hypothetical protein